MNWIDRLIIGGVIAYWIATVSLVIPINNALDKSPLSRGAYVTLIITAPLAAPIGAIVLFFGQSYWHECVANCAGRK